MSTTNEPAAYVQWSTRWSNGKVSAPANLGAKIPVDDCEEFVREVSP